MNLDDFMNQIHQLFNKLEKTIFVYNSDRMKDNNEQCRLYYWLLPPIYDEPTTRNQIDVPMTENGGNNQNDINTTVANNGKN